MSQILVRQLATEAHHALKARAKKLNRSAESVAREILEVSLLPESNLGLGSRMAVLWEGADLTGTDFERDKTPYVPVDL
jgi:plasmid stability protein